ncbi:porin [Variovorax sp. J31P207]|uniref:porin n=1 Tax=Variovorax sp. J31P207 TaxID=3053510 RepID=UPI0025754A06|nr:porin [Variovorax sp. J31P207]MDM0066891.1 porin [Variovorax sp. J31P207]
MRKSLVALAVLTVGGVASAQSSVTMFGVVDAAVSGFSNKSETPLGTSVTTSSTRLTNSSLTPSRLGFRGVEDLGGGLAAGFWLESSLGNDDGTIGGNVANSGPAVIGFFNRRSTVSLSGTFGEVRLGRDFTPTYLNDTIFDPMGAAGVGASIIYNANGGFSTASPGGFTANQMYARASNSIGYFLPSGLGGFYGQVLYAFNEKTSYDPGTLTPPGAAGFIANPSAAGDNARAGRYIGGRVGYAKGPVDVALAYGQSTLASNFFAGTTQTLDIWNLGGSWDFGVVKLFGEYSNNKLKNDSSSSVVNSVTNPFAFREPGANGWLLGGTVPVGPGLIRFSYSTIKYDNTTRINQLTGLFAEPKADKWALGYVHNLSKRTALYATIARINNSDGAGLAVGGPNFYTTPITVNGVRFTPQASSSTGYDFGLRHVF